LGSEKSTTEVVAPPVSAKTWAYLIIYIVLLNLIITVQNQFLPPHWGTGGFNIGPSGYTWAAMPLPYVFSFVMLIIFNYTGFRVDKRTFALFYIATMVSTWVSVNKGYANIFSGLMNVRTTTEAVHGYAVPWFWLPSGDAIRGLYYRGSLHNFFVTYAHEWIPVILTHFWWYISSYVWMLGWAVVLRRLWIDIEVLPFPHAQGWITGEIALSAMERKPDRRKKIFVIGAIIMILFYVPYMVYTANPSLPDPYGWLTGYGFITFLSGAYDACANPVYMSTIAAPTFIHTDPLRYVFPFLAPLDFLLSMWVGGFIFLWIAPQILTYFGYYGGSAWYTTGFWGRHGQIFFGPPLYVFAICEAIGVGIVFFMFVFNWKYFASMIKRAFSEKGSPTEVSYGLGVLMVLAGSISLAILFIVSTNEVLDSILVVFIALTVGILARARTRAYSGGDVWYSQYWLFKPLWGETMPAAPDFPAGKLFLTFHVNHTGIGFDEYGIYLAPIFGTMDSYKIGSMAGVDSKTIFKLVLIGSIISILIVIPLVWIVWHTFGYMEIPTVKEWDWFWWVDAGAYNSRINVFASWQGWFGFLLAGLLIFLKSRYIWWPLEPIGFFVGVSPFSMPCGAGVFTPFIVWVIKLLVIKVGGRKLYDEVALPAAFGLIVGGTIGVLSCGIIAIVRYILFGL